MKAKLLSQVHPTLAYSIYLIGWRDGMYREPPPEPPVTLTDAQLEEFWFRTFDGDDRLMRVARGE